MHDCEPLHILPASVQSAHGAPPAPHALSMLPATQVFPCKHPAHSHCLEIVLQVSLLAVHDTQALPPLPHASSAVPRLQVLPVQQPSPHEVVLQTQVPVLGSHACPSAHAGPLFCH